MDIKPLAINGMYLIENYYYKDNRGAFIKVFSETIYNKYGIEFSSKEVYYSISNKNVIRGMHFQLPPYDHAKLIFVLSGELIDVVLDIRKNSTTYGKFVSIKLEQHKNSLLIPKGCAHGFKSISDNTIILYNQTSCYKKEFDSGILWNSFGYDWKVEKPIISGRDQNFLKFENFKTPF